MAESTFSMSGYQHLEREINASAEGMSDLFDYVSRKGQGLDALQKYDDGSLKAFLVRVSEVTNMLFSLRDALKNYEEMVSEQLSLGERAAENLPDVPYDLPEFDDAMPKPRTETYSKYQSYKFADQGHDFLEDFNDLDAFIASDLYQKKGRWTIGSMLDDYELMARGLYASFTGDLSVYDDYTNDRLKAALASMLDGLPGAGDTGLSVSGYLEDKVEEDTGIRDIGAWVKELISLMKSAAKASKGNQFFTDPQYLKWLAESGDKKQVVHMVLTKLITEDGWELIGSLGDKLDTMAKGIGMIDILVDILQRVMGEYTVQLEYIDTMQDSLIESGFPYGPVHEMLNDLRTEYSDSVAYALEQAGDELWKKIKKGALKEATDAIPLLGQIDKGLSLGATAAKLFGGKYIDADESLMGLRQFDQVLTNTYQNHLQRMKAGIADEEDMQKLDQLFNMLVNTKKKEYEAMMTMSKGTAKYDEYKEKLDDLEEWLP